MKWSCLEQVISFVASSCCQTMARVTETADRRPVAIDGVELAVVASGKGGDVVEQDSGIDRRFRFQITEDDQRPVSVPASCKEFPEGMSQSRTEGMIPVSHHEDDVGFHPCDDMFPTDGIQIEDGVIEVLDAGEHFRRSVPDSVLDPATGKFSSFHRGIEADDPDFMTEQARFLG